MRDSIGMKAIEVCRAEISQKGESVSIAFYAFIADKTDEPELLMRVATWWIFTHNSSHFEKAIKSMREVCG